MSKPVTPLVAVDGIIEYSNRLVVIERKFEPLGLAWPGGFVDVGETLHQALRREMMEEVNLKVDIECMVGIWDAPDRDDRGHTISIVYLCTAVDGELEAKDDAKDVYLLTLQEALSTPMVLDHNAMLKRAINQPAFSMIKLLGEYK